MTKLNCSTCKRNLLLTMFAKRRNATRGYDYLCKDCKRVKRVADKNGNLRVQMQSLIRTSRSACNKRGITDYEIDADYLEVLFVEQGGLCAVSGMELTLVSGKGCVATNASIDRIDNSIGYKKGNIQMLCRSVNSLKMNMSEIDFNNFMDKMSINWINKRDLIDNNCSPSTVPKLI